MCWHGWRTLGTQLVPAPSSTRLLSACGLCAHVYMYMFLEGLFPENTSPPPAAHTPSLLLLTTIPPPVSWVGDLGCRLSLSLAAVFIGQGCSREVVQ